MECWAIDGVEPLEVISPSSEDQLGRVVASANADRTAIFPRGGSTRVDLGGIPSRPGIAIDITGIDQVVAHNYADLTATFQAGLTMRQVSQTLSRHGQMLAVDPPIPGRATIGGTLATGVSGPLKWHFGHPRDTVIGMKVVQPDGQVTKSGGQVVKNVSGYDMPRLHVGGLGSLGIILEASFKLTPIPMYEKTTLAAFRGIEEAQTAALGIFNSHVMPLAMTAFDAAAARRIGMEDDPNRWRLAVRLGGRSRTLDRQVDDVTSICRQADARELEPVEGRSADQLWSFAPRLRLGYRKRSPSRHPRLSASIRPLQDRVRSRSNEVPRARSIHRRPARIRRSRRLLAHLFPLSLNGTFARSSFRRRPESRGDGWGGALPLPQGRGPEPAPDSIRG